ncbi:MAG: PIN domain-containing protein [Thermoplasmata archaeon]
MLRVLVDTNTIVSGLFFPGNERRILVLAIRGDIRLVLPEDVYDEALRVIAGKFSGSDDIEPALLLLRVISEGSEMVPRIKYAALIPKGREMAPHASDAPIIAAALGTEPDIFVTGDRALLGLADALPVMSSRAALGRIEHDAQGRK